MPVSDSSLQTKYHRAFLLNFVAGIGWALGMSVGFALLVYLITSILSALGGIPLIGTFFADIINTTLEALSTKSPVL